MGEVPRFGKIAKFLTGETQSIIPDQSHWSSYTAENGLESSNH